MSYTEQGYLHEYVLKNKALFYKLILDSDTNKLGRNSIHFVMISFVLN
jgi:hypothetical protein